jgi:hypothetical protein
MASTRSTQRTQRPQPASPTDSPKQAFVALARSAARMQIAACSAAVTSFAGWAPRRRRDHPLLAHAQIQLDVGRPLIAPEHITFPQGL